MCKEHGEYRKEKKRLGKLVTNTIVATYYRATTSYKYMCKEHRKHIKLKKAGKVSH